MRTLLALLAITFLTLALLSIPTAARQAPDGIAAGTEIVPAPEADPLEAHHSTLDAENVATPDMRTTAIQAEMEDLPAGWYSRNLNMGHHILRTVKPDDERVLVLGGAGHVRVPRHVLDEAPHFCPVSPLPTLQ